MRNLFLALSAMLLTGTASYALSSNPYEDSMSCVMVYSKYLTTQPNLTIACDGERVLTHQIRTEDMVEDPVQFRAELYASFQALTNSNGLKSCHQYDYDEAWWASCIRK